MRSRWTRSSAYLPLHVRHDSSLEVGALEVSTPQVFARQLCAAERGIDQLRSSKVRIAKSVFDKLAGLGRGILEWPGYVNKGAVPI
jgi:hypothetical protein